MGLYETRSGFVRPERTVQEHVRRAVAAGADLRFEERALRWESDDSGVRVTTTRGTVEADRLVVAPGAWAPQVLADLGVPMTVTRELVFWFEPSADPASYEPGRQPIFIWERPGASLYGFPCLDGVGRGAKVGLHRHGLPTDPDALDREVADHEVEEVAGVLRQLVPTLPGTFVRAVACLYTTTPDQPLRDRPPSHTGRTSRSRAGSPGTASSSCPSSARCWPTSPSSAAPSSRSGSSTPAGSARRRRAPGAAA